MSKHLLRGLPDPSFAPVNSHHIFDYVFNFYFHPNFKATFLAASRSRSAYICVVLIWACPVAALAGTIAIGGDIAGAAVPVEIGSHGGAAAGEESGGNFHLNA